MKAQHDEHDDAAHDSSANGAEHAAGSHHEGGDLQAASAGGEVGHDRGAVASLGGFLSRLVYTASYTVSYGVVFPVMFVAYSVPTENALVRGLVDGGRAARDAVAALHSESAHTASSDSVSSAEPVPA